MVEFGHNFPRKGASSSGHSPTSPTLSQLRKRRHSVLFRVTTMRSHLCYWPSLLLHNYVQCNPSLSTVFLCLWAFLTILHDWPSMTFPLILIHSLKIVAHIAFTPQPHLDSPLSDYEIVPKMVFRKFLHLCILPQTTFDPLTSYPTSSPFIFPTQQLKCIPPHCRSKHRFEVIDCNEEEIKTLKY